MSSGERMQRRISGFLAAIFLVFSMICVSNVRTVEAEGTIYIRADGSVEGTDKILRNGNTYGFIDNINGSIIVERDGIVIDGSGKTLWGLGNGTGIDLSFRRHVLVRNLTVRSYSVGIYIFENFNLADSSGSHDNNEILSCRLVENDIGIEFFYNINVLSLLGYSDVVFGDNIVYSSTLLDNNVAIHFEYNVNSLTLSD